MFASIQGEGPYTGIPMFFVRTNRCNLRCTWCDSQYTFYGGKEVSLDEILGAVEESGMSWVCLTGGEPLLQKDALDLVKNITSKGRSVLVETGGSLPVHPFTEIDRCFIDMDIKTPSSDQQDSLYEDNLRVLRETDYVKFVISSEEDFEYSRNLLEKVPSHVQAVFQPAWGSDMKWIVERVLNEHLEVRVMSQLHKQIWGEVPGK